MGKILVYEDNEGATYHASDDAARRRELSNKFILPKGYTFVYPGDNVARALSVMCVNRSLEYIEVRAAYNFGRLRGYYFPDSVIEKYKKLHGIEDINDLC